MKRLILLLALVVSSRAAAQETVVKTFGAGPTVSLRIWLPAGSIRLHTWDRDSIRVIGKIGKGFNFFGGAGALNAKLGVEQPDKRASTLARGDLVVTVPRHAQVFVKSTDAVIEVSETSGDIELITVGGRVTVSDVKGVVSVETVDAPITVRRADGVVRLHTGGGKMILGDIGGDLSASTIRGDVELAGERLGEAQIETVSGRVLINGRLRPGAFLDVQTHEGSIDLRLPTNEVPLLELLSRTGIVTNGLGVGSSKVGRIAVRSFKGGVNVMARAGVEGGKQRLNP